MKHAKQKNKPCELMRPLPHAIVHNRSANMSQKKVRIIVASDASTCIGLAAESDYYVLTPVRPHSIDLGDLLCGDLNSLEAENITARNVTKGETVTVRVEDFDISFADALETLLELLPSTPAGICTPSPTLALTFSCTGFVDYLLQLRGRGAGSKIRTRIPPARPRGQPAPLRPRMPGDQ
jgi:hypothetical protein